MRSGRCGSLSRWALGCLLALAGCSNGPDKKAPPPDTWENVCIDMDGDGHGFQCQAGEDCDDSNANIFEGCFACGRPAEGCACEDDTPPVDCTLPKEITANGGLLCKTGTRYCRDGKWSGCEGIKSFEAPPPSHLLNTAVIDSDAAAEKCDFCHPDCYRLDDPVSPVGEAGPPGSTIQYRPDGGGITLSQYVNDAALPNPGDDLDPIPPCNPALDTDCDGVPNALDPYPAAKPFVTSYATIFMDLPAGTAESTTRQLKFTINTADVYFLIDMTGSMSEERTVLFNSLTSGNFLDNPATPENETPDGGCVVDSDAGLDAGANNYLMDAGITGNIACRIKNSGFGLGWYREIPFQASDNYGIRYSYPDFEAYEHRQDISTNVTATANALNLLYTRGNRNWAESATVALQAVATGQQIYMGWDRPGIPTKTCASGRYGYPCFRNEAIPIVVLITDAPMMNGPVPDAGNLGNENSNYPTSGANLQPVNYLDGGLRYMARSSDSTYYPVSGNESFDNAHDAGVIDNSFKTYTGDTRGMAANIHARNLGIVCPGGEWPADAGSDASPGYPDAVFKFKVDTAKTLTVSTRGTRHSPTLAIVPASAANNAPTLVDATSSNNHNFSSLRPLGTFPTNVNIEISGNTAPATYDTGNYPTYAMRDCFRGTGGTTTAPDAVYSFTAGASGPVTFAADGAGFEAVLALYDALPTSSEHTVVNTPVGSTNDKFWDTGSVVPNATTPAATAASPGVVNGRSIWMKGGDTGVTALNNYATAFYTGVVGDSTCNNVTGATRDVVFDFVVNGTTNRTIAFETTLDNDSTAAAAFDHVIALQTRPTTSGGTLTSPAAACNMDFYGTRRSAFSRVLAPGTYSLMLRGERYTTCCGGGTVTADDKGKYGLIITDTAVQPRACHNESVAASFTANLTAGTTYYLVMRGRSTSSGGGRGQYTIRINNAGGACAFDNTSYVGSSGDLDYNPHQAEVTQNFAVGEYYAVVKGNSNNPNWDPDPPASDTARGWYQITMGDPTLATNNQTASMPGWGNADAGVLAELTSRRIRVINVTSTITASGAGCPDGGTCAAGAANQNQALKDQANIISNLTGAKGPPIDGGLPDSGTPLRFDISNNGSGMGFAIVDAINKLANNLKMDVALRLVPQPDNPTAPRTFVFKGRAVDNGISDRCDGIRDSDGDGVFETHTGCIPGSEPRFEMTFTNPPASTGQNVLPNPAPLPDGGIKGGYDMRVEVVGDDRFVVDSVPVYILPDDAGIDPPLQLYNPTGYYYQDVSATGCMGNERPDWQSLYWAGTIPTGTSLNFRMCAGQTAAELAACVAANDWELIANVTGGQQCVAASECMNGYCTSTGRCEFPTRPGCSSSADCGNWGSCVANACVWSRNPIDMKPAVAAGFNGMKHVRLQVQLNATTSRVEAPAITSLRLDYLCAPGE
jgi:hypothetical protein